MMANSMGKPVPRYFFNIVDGDGGTSDPEGVELADLEAVRRDAILDAKSLVADDLKAGRAVPIGRKFEVTDETGEIVLTLSFVEAINQPNPS